MEWKYILQFYNGFITSLCAISMMGFGFFLYRSFMENTSIHRRFRFSFVISLWLADVLMVATHAIPSAISAVKKEWSFGISGCQWHAFIGLMTCIGSSWSSVTMFLHQFKGKALRRTHEYIILTTIWTIAILSALLPTFIIPAYGFESELEISCGLQLYMPNSFVKVYVFYMMLIAFILPLIAIGFISDGQKFSKLRVVVCTQLVLAHLPYMVIGGIALAGVPHPSNLTAILNLIAMITYKCKTASDPYLYVFMIPKPKTKCRFTEVYQSPIKEKEIPIDENIFFRQVSRFYLM